MANHEEKWIETMEKKIDKVFSKLTYSDENKNKKHLKKLLKDFLDFYQPTDFLFVLLAKKRDESKTKMVFEFVCDNFNVDFNFNLNFSLRDKFNHKNVIQVMIEAGYSTNFIEYVINSFSKHYISLDYDSFDLDGNSIFHTLAFSFGNTIDIFRIYHILIKEPSLSHVETWHNNNGESFISIITNIVDKYEQNSNKGNEVSDLILWARIINLKDTIAYYYSRHFLEFSLLFTDDNEHNRKIINEKMTYNGYIPNIDISSPSFEQYIQNQYGIYPIEGLLNLCVQEEIDGAILIFVINELVDTGLVNVNYMDNAGCDFISKAILEKKDISDIYNLLNIALENDINHELLINVIRTAIFTHNDASKIYHFLASKGLNLLEHDSLITNEDMSKIVSSSSHNLAKYMSFRNIVDEIRFIQSNVNLLKAINLELEELGLQARILSNVPFDRTKLVDYKNYTDDFINLEFAKMVANQICDNRINSVNNFYNNKEVEPLEVYNAINICVEQLDNLKPDSYVKIKRGKTS